MQQVIQRQRLLSRVSKIDPYDFSAFLLLVGLAILVALTYGDYGVSNDEGVQQTYGELIIRYYESGFTDRAVFNFDNLYLYGGLFDLMATGIAKLVPLHLYDVRHILCAAFGVGGIAATFATARMIGGARAGLIAAAALAVCGAWYGGMFNHTKDVTFGAAMIGATFMLLRVTRDLPRPRWRDVILLGVLIGAALGLRALGLLLVGYVGLAILGEAALRPLGSIRERLVFVGRSALTVSPALLLGYLIMVAVWPWAVLEPLNPVRAIVDFSEFKYPIDTLLAGHTYTMSTVPRWYVPAYLLIKLPLITFTGAALALMFATVSGLTRKRFMGRMPREIGLLAFTAVFPVLCHVIGHGPAFTGMRHFLFVVPPIAALAGVGYDLLIAGAARWRPAAAVGLGVATAAALLWNAGVLVRLHPYEYLYYNPIVGGLKGAAGRYDTDYWVNMMPEAVHDLEAYLARTERRTGARGTPYSVAICAERLQFDNATNDQLRWINDWDRADFFISPTHMDCDTLVKGKVIARVERMGTLIGVVKDRRAITRPALAHTSRAVAPRSPDPARPLNTRIR
jgi:hypothetical protein